jgi:hypothetical protein
LKKSKKKSKNIFGSLKKGSTFALPIHGNESVSNENLKVVKTGKNKIVL